MSYNGTHRRSEENNPFDDLKQYFLLTLKADPRHEEVITRLRGQLDKNIDFFSAWVNALFRHSHNSENKPRIKSLIERLEKRRRGQEWESDELATLLGTKPDEALPALIGFSLMRVSHHYQEIYYSDIMSDILPQNIIDFTKSSVSVPGYGGSVGLAIKNENGSKYVRNSFTDVNGIVACEDLISGNVCILMQTLYNQQGQPMAVVFCSLPIPEVFVEEDLELFTRSVQIYRSSFLSHCRRKDVDGFGDRFKKLMHQQKSRSTTAEDLLRSLVTSNTQNNPIGAVFGLLCSVKDSDTAVIKSVTVCERHLERQEWLFSFLEEQFEPQNRLSFNLTTGDKKLGELVFVFSKVMGVRASDSPIPPEVVEPFKYLWETFNSSKIEINISPVNGNLVEIPEHSDKEMERTKIAADMIVALMGQLLYFVAEVLVADDLPNQGKQYADNLQMILELEKAYEEAYSGKPFSGWDGDLFVKKLRGWVDRLKEKLGCNLITIIAKISNISDLDPEIKAASLWRSDSVFARIDPEKWSQWLNDRFKIYDNQLPLNIIGTHEGNCFASQHSEFNDLFLKKMGVKYQHPVPLFWDNEHSPRAYFRLCSLAPIVDGDTNPIIDLVATFYTMVLLEQDKARAAEEATLARFARGASHGLKNALVVPGIILQRGRLVKDILTMLDQVEYLPSRENEALRRLAESAKFVEEEVTYLEQQAELFFWVMDKEKARDRIKDRVQSLPPRSLRQSLLMSFLRGLYLPIETRLMPKELAPAMKLDDSKSDGDLIRDFLNLLNSQMISANNDLMDDAIKGIQASIGDKTHLDLSVGTIPDGVFLEGLLAFLTDAVLMELCQNAAKAAFLSAHEMHSIGKKPFLGISVEQSQDEVTIAITNSAKESDRKTLQETNTQALKEKPESSEIATGGGIGGIWQIRMLCDQLGKKRIMLSEQPKLDEELVTFKLTLKVGSEEQHE